MWYPSLITRNPSRARQPMSRENVAGLLRLLQDFFQIKIIENIYFFKTIIIKKHGNVFKTWLCPNFLLLPKKSEWPKIWGGCSPLAPPARTPKLIGWRVFIFVEVVVVVVAVIVIVVMVVVVVVVAVVVVVVVVVAAAVLENCFICIAKQRLCYIIWKTIVLIVF